jgi:hypothetical protein
VLRAFASTSGLLINDQSSGVGTILDKSRLQELLRRVNGAMSSWKM